jgi:hypothetical protein
MPRNATIEEQFRFAQEMASQNKGGNMKDATLDLLSMFLPSLLGRLGPKVKKFLPIVLKELKKSGSYGPYTAPGLTDQEGSFGYSPSFNPEAPPAEPRTLEDIPNAISNEDFLRQMRKR